MLWPFGSNTADVLTGKTQTEQKFKKEIENEIQEESGWDRVKKIFDKE